MKIGQKLKFSNTEHVHQFWLLYIEKLNNFMRTWFNDVTMVLPIFSMKNVGEGEQNNKFYLSKVQGLKGYSNLSNKNISRVLCNWE